MNNIYTSILDENPSHESTVTDLEKNPSAGSNENNQLVVNSQKNMLEDIISQNCDQQPLDVSRNYNSSENCELIHVGGMILQQEVIDSGSNQSIEIGNIVKLVGNTLKEMTTDEKLDMIISNQNVIISNQNAILKMLGSVLDEQENLTKDNVEIKKSFKSLNIAKPRKMDASFLEEFPISKEEDLGDFNKKLCDGGTMEAIASALRFAVGSTGSTSQQNVNSIMGKMFDDQLLKDFSALGVRGKKNFSLYNKVAELVWITLKEIYQHKTFEESVRDVLMKIGTYLKYASSRLQPSKSQKKEVPEGVSTNNTN